MITEKQIIEEMISDINCTAKLLEDDSIPVKYRCYASELFVRLNIKFSELLVLQGEKDCKKCVYYNKRNETCWAVKGKCDQSNELCEYRELKDVLQGSSL